MVARSFARLSGVWLPIRREQWSESDARVGSKDTSVTGVELEVVVAERRLFNVSTAPMTPGATRALKGLVKGLGDLWPFTVDLRRISSKGSGIASFVTITLATGPFGDLGRMGVGSGATAEMSNAALLPGAWQVEVWRAETAAVDGGSFGVVDGWHHYALQGATSFTPGTPNPAGLTQWRDGLLGNWYAGNWFGMTTAGHAQFLGKASGGANAAKDYSQVITRPFQMPVEWLPWIAARTAPEALLPDLLLEGDAVDGGIVKVRGVPEKRDRTVVVIGGSAKGSRFAFSLMEQPS